jgi:Ferritin-like domain
MRESDMLIEFDRDGAVAETAEAAGVSRSALLRRAAIGGGALLGSGALLGLLPSVAGAATAGDVAILNFALTLEYLESAFYKEAIAKGKLTGETAKFAKTVSAHEAAHVAFLKKALGSHAVKSPSFDFKDTTASMATFQKTSMALEDTGVAAYAGQGPLIKDKTYVAAALSVHSVEARHASWIRDIIGKGGAPLPAPVPFDAAKTMSQVLAIVKGTGFITG